ncbi:hypothetical protein SPRG_11443 [Saprolegnia parasitica CBS 223.65]|uniref:RRM domain-containing protein n=1 Tax=Saprolegnia parasitica (strain CBS 223.65) TaxID=695850 RepID=A0A067CAE4_SAPPC|nr:hypothetical protein SPRG_11443 [Saprolegnia parasitica CBS 223.65]KDO23521.1 hypothetical protein SPRG_11443 [Saprolegnia parasitica CBS 223.65]|eukprot:XP_012205834.1 hypothetical protein SPRG_11443 [Saprolegnia parasitica CBS 223.65]
MVARRGAKPPAKPTPAPVAEPSSASEQDDANEAAEAATEAITAATNASAEEPEDAEPANDNGRGARGHDTGAAEDDAGAAEDAAEDDTGSADEEAAEDDAPASVDDDAMAPVAKKAKKAKKETKKGVIYMSRVPPFMKPEKVRHLLSQYGDIERIYLVEEDKTARKKRLKAGGNKKVNFTEGWIEFSHKSVAKRVAAALNTKPMGGKKRGFYYDDIWNLKYLKGFQWAHLTEKIAYENRVRDQKLRLEIAQAAKENAAFMERVEQSKQIDKMEARKKAEAIAVPNAMDNIRRTFRQNAPADKSKQASLGENSKALLTKVFKKRKHDEAA